MTDRRRQQGLTDKQAAQDAIDREVNEAKEQYAKRFKRLMDDDDFRVWLYHQITQRCLLMAGAPVDRGDLALARFEGRRDVGREMFEEASTLAPGAWLKVLGAVEREVAKHKARMKQIEARYGVPQPVTPEESTDA